jgi:hypothetical protein
MMVSVRGGEMNAEERRMFLTVLETIEASINVLEKKVDAAERVLAKSHPDLYAAFQTERDSALQGPLTASAQMLREQRRKILANIQE